MEQYSVQTVKDGSEVAEDLHSLVLGSWYYVTHYSGYQKTFSLSPPCGGSMTFKAVNKQDSTGQVCVYVRTCVFSVFL